MGRKETVFIPDVWQKSKDSRLCLHTALFPECSCLRGCDQTAQLHLWFVNYNACIWIPLILSKEPTKVTKKKSIAHNNLE